MGGLGLGGFLVQGVERTADVSRPSVPVVHARELAVPQAQLSALHRVTAKRIFHQQQGTRNLVRIYLLVLFYSEIINYAF